MFAIVVDVVTNEIKEGVLQEILYTDVIVFIADSMAELQEKFYGWKSALEKKGLKVTDENKGNGDQNLAGYCKTI